MVVLIEAWAWLSVQENVEANFRKFLFGNDQQSGDSSTMSWWVSG